MDWSFAFGCSTSRVSATQFFSSYGQPCSVRRGPPSRCCCALAGARGLPSLATAVVKLCLPRRPLRHLLSLGCDALSARQRTGSLCECKLSVCEASIQKNNCSDLYCFANGLNAK